MMRTTIDYGIDLGTQQSCIGVFDGTEAHVIRNIANAECTPSAVWIDKNGRLFVGATAYDRLEQDPQNAFSEFKLQMGTDTTYKFLQSGRTMRSEELSAEVLKSLLADAFRMKGERVQAAVITVPAAFELPQTQATNKAAQLAGLILSPLLQEPVAAAMAYGFQSKSNKVFWLVYDFGGGTFDAAVVSIRDDVIQVVNHGGDNHLGGKLIDWEIVEQLLVPALLKDHKLTDFRRGNPKWISAFAKLRRQAEEAKIRVSEYEAAPICIDFLCNNDRGEPVSFEYDLQKGDVERLMEPFVLRSINTCCKVLVEKRLGPANIEKILLVGEATQHPYLRQRLADPREGLGVALDFSIDPITVLARGAAVFAATQRKGLAPEPVKAGEFVIDLDYKPVGSDPEPMVGVRVATSADGDLVGYTIEFVNSGVRPPWRSGRIGLASDGAFTATLWAEAGCENVFNIELRDARGALRKTSPDSFTYRIGIAITDPPLTHTVGIALANNEMEVFFEKGTPLPARKRKVLKTESDFKRGDIGDLIRFPVVEGENLRRADRNMLIGTLRIHASKIRRDIPAGSDIEISIEIDQERLIRVKAYIPWIEEEFEEVFDLIKKNPTLDQLKAETESEKKRLENVRKKAKTVTDAKVQETLQRIDSERMVHDVDAALGAAHDDPDAADKCGKRLLDLRQAIDDAEDALEWPDLVREAEEEIRDTGEVVRQFGKSGDREMATALEKDIRETIKSHDLDLLRRKIGELSNLRLRLLREQAGTAPALVPRQSPIAPPARMTPAAVGIAALAPQRPVPKAPAPGTANNSARAMRESVGTSVSESEEGEMDTSGTTPAISSLSSEILLSAACPDLFRKNAFRVTGLTVEATAGDIARQSEMLRMAEKYGSGNRLPSAMPLTPPPDPDQIREAVDRLRDPERRLVDEFFWFWPHELGGSQNDEALSALRRSEDEQAAGIWRHQGSTGSISNVSMHNLAVLMHAKALDLEFQKNAGGVIDPKKRTELWKSAYQIWKVLLEDEGFWSRLTARIRDLDDPRLTTGTARRMRNSLPLALLMISAQLAVSSAEEGKAEEAKWHLGMMKASGLGNAVVQEALLLAMGPIRDRIKTLCQTADKETDVHPERGDVVTERLLAQAIPLLAALDLILPAGSPARDGTHDEVALIGLKCQIAFGNKTENWKKSVALLEAVLPVAVGAAARARIEENLRIVRKNRELGICFFCGDGDADDQCAIEKKMFGDVVRTHKIGGYRITFRQRTIKVPRCRSCMSAHNKFAGWTAAAVVTSILTGISSCNIASSYPDGDTISVVMLFAFSIGGSVLGTLLAKYYFRKNIRPAGHANKYGDIKDLLKSGWQFGAEPQS